MLRLANFLERRMKVARREDKPVPAGAGEQTALQRPPKEPFPEHICEGCESGRERVITPDGKMACHSPEGWACEKFLPEKVYLFNRSRKAAVQGEDSPARATRGDQWRDCLERLLEEDGYVIQASSEEMAPGESVRMWGTDKPFRVIEGADYADALRQWRVYQEVIGEEMEPPAPPSAQWHYYRYGPRP